MSDEREPFPFDDLHAAGPEEPDYRAALTDFHAEYGNALPDAERLRSRADRLRAFGALAGPFERWWLDPRTQAFVAELAATGI